MYSITKYNRNSDPFTDLARDFFGLSPFSSRQSNTAFRTVPSFDFLENAEGYTLRGDLPGLSEEELDITVHDGILTIAGTRQAEETQEGDTFLVRERRYGQFSRRLSLPKDADAEKVSAKLEHGVLTVHIGKRQELQARKIKIS